MAFFLGLIYNDIFAKSFNIFGSNWDANMTFDASEEQPLGLTKVLMLDPKNPGQYAGHPYPFGIDPAWQAASNKIGFLNTYKGGNVSRLVLWIQNDLFRIQNQVQIFKVPDLSHVI